MLVSKGVCEETSKDIIYEFEELLCNNDIKINNLDSNKNKFESEASYINKKDYDKLVEKITKQLKEFAEFIKEKIEEAA